MRHKKNTFKIGRTSSHRKALLSNQICSLILNKEIKTTPVKAKATKRLAEKMVTLAKSGTLHDRRRAVSMLGDETAVKMLFEEIAPKFSERKGGYLRILRLYQRKGDAAEICLLQWVENFSPEKPEQTEKKAPAKKKEKAPKEAKAEAKKE